MLFDANTQEEREKASRYMRENINAPYVSAKVSILGGAHRASVMIVLSLDKKETWANGILQNSRYLMFRLERDGELENFQKDYKIKAKRMRKTKAKSLGDAVVKINKYLAQVR